MDGQDAVEKTKKLHPDIVVMDVSMPRLNGLDATREIKRLLPDTEVVIVSQHEAPEMVRQAFNAGARGYVVKSAISADLLAAIAKAKKRETFVKAVRTGYRKPESSIRRKFCSAAPLMSKPFAKAKSAFAPP